MLTFCLADPSRVAKTKSVFFIISKGEAHVRPRFQIYLQQDGTVRVLYTASGQAWQCHRPP
jgi:hypothetical protein